MRISEMIEEIMIEHHLSQANLAKMLNVSQKAVSNWINEVDKPNTNSLLAIYNNFGITPNSILGIETDVQYSQKLDHSTDEQILLRAYRQMSEGKKRALFQMLDINIDEVGKKKA